MPRITITDLSKAEVRQLIAAKNGTRANDLPSRAQLDDIAEAEALKDGDAVARTQLQQLLAKNKMVPIFQFPYGSKCNPVEAVWALVKHRLAKRWEGKRTVQMTIQQLREGFKVQTSTTTRWRTR
jgi:hypothetical protein